MVRAGCDVGALTWTVAMLEQLRRLRAGGNSGSGNVGLDTGVCVLGIETAVIGPEPDLEDLCLSAVRWVNEQ